jgi:hypothetical protein
MGGRSLAPAFCGALLIGAHASAQLTSPRPDVYEMTDVGGGWFRAEEAVAQGRDVWILPGSGSSALFTQCEIRLAPADAFTSGDFVDTVMWTPPDQYVPILSRAFPGMTAFSALARIEVDGLPAVTLTVQALVNGAPTTWLSVIMYRAGHVVTVSCGSLADRFERNRAALVDFIDQIRFSPDGAHTAAAGAGSTGEAAAAGPADATAGPTGAPARPGPVASAAAGCGRGEIGGDLRLAVNRDCRALLTELIAAGADPNQRDDSGGTLLFNAASLDNADMIRLLVAAGADVDARDVYGNTALTAAAFDGGARAARALLDLGADPNSEDENGATPIYHAAGFGEDEILRMLLDAGADPDAPASVGQTPLILAALADEADAVRMLLEAGADFGKRTARGETALDVAASEAIRRLLIDAGATE